MTGFNNVSMFLVRSFVSQVPAEMTDGGMSSAFASVNLRVASSAGLATELVVTPSAIVTLQTELLASVVPLAVSVTSAVLSPEFEVDAVKVVVPLLQLVGDINSSFSKK